MLSQKIELLSDLVEQYPDSSVGELSSAVNFAHRSFQERLFNAAIPVSPS